MLRFPLSTPANPYLKSSLPSYGYKPSESYVTFSVGVLSVDAGGYLTKNRDGDDVTVNVVGGVMTFSFPQNNSYVGVGDKVVAGGVDYYINEKINVKTWKVNTVTGSLPSDASDQTVNSINKTFSTLKDAINGSTSGAYGFLSSHDLVSLNKCLRIAVYSMEDTYGEIVITDNWVTDASRYVRIFSPWDIKRECNSKQRHNGIFGSGYQLTVGSSFGIKLNSEYSEVEGLAIDCNSNSYGIEIGSTGIWKKVLNNIIKNASSYGVSSRSTGVFVGNIIFDCTTAINDIGGEVSIANNTIVDVTTGIIGGASTSCVNNIIQGATTSLSGLSALNVANTITNDGLLSSTMQTVVFKDSSSDDFHLDYRSDGVLSPLTGGISFADNYNFPFDRDIDTEKVTGSGWHIGADYYVPTATFAIGFPFEDIKTGSPSGVVSNGVLTFNVGQTDDRLCVGCKVTIGAYTCFLYERISDLSWKVTNGSGLVAADNGSASVTEINYAYDNIYTAVYLVSDAVPTPGVIQDGWINSADIVTDGIKVSLACTAGKIYAGSRISSDFQTDENHFVKIYAPNNVGVDCNTSRRHQGVLDDSLCILNGVDADTTVSWNHLIDGLAFHAPYTVVDGIQITASGNGISVEINATNVTISNCIIFDVKEEGISIDLLDGGNSKIFNNIIYRCGEKGLGIYSNEYLIEEYTYQIYNNTIIDCDYGIYLEIFKDYKVGNNIILVNNVVQNCDTDYFSTQGPSDKIISITNYSSDNSIRKIKGENDVESFEVLFLNKYHDDYHLTLYDSLRMENVTDLSSDANLEFSTDIDGEDRSTYKWDAGADNWSPRPGNWVDLSVGASVTNMGSGITGMTIQDSVITFVGSVSEDMGIGDEVAYNDGAAKTCYLSEKGTSNIWLARSGAGEANIADVTSSIAVTSITRASDTIKNMIGKTSSDAETIIGSTQDLVTAEIKRLNIACYNDSSDTGDISISGWTTSADYLITISSPWDIKTQCGTTQRHSGTWVSGGFAIEASGANCVTIDQDFLTFFGIRIKPLNNTYTAVELGTSCENTAVLNNIIKEADIAVEQLTGGAGEVVVAGNFIYDTVTSGVDVREGAVYNNTIVSDVGSGIRSNENVRVWNNLIQGSLTCYNSLDVGSEPDDYDYKLNIASDSSLPTISGNKNSATLIFNDASSDDYHLFRGDFIAFNQGVNLSQDEIYPFNIDNNSIYLNGLWSIGADVEPDFDDVDLYFSVSKNQSELRTAFDPITSDPAEVTISNGVSTFTVEQIEEELGVGDILTYDSTKSCYLFEKISLSQWEVRTKYGELPDDELTPVSVDSIKHTFENLSDAVHETGGLKYFFGDANNPFWSFYFAKIRVHLAFFNSMPLQLQDEEVFIRDYVATEDYYLRIFTPYDKIKHCNKIQRHDGYFNQPEGMQSTINMVSSVEAAILIRTPYTIIDGVLINSNNSVYSGNVGIRSQEAIGVKILGNVVADSYNGIVNGGDTEFLFNDFSYSGDKSAFWDTEFQNPAWPSRTIENGKFAVTQSASGDYNYINLTDPSLSPALSGAFDLEFGVYIDDDYTGVDFQIHLRLFPVGSSVPSAPQSGPGVIPPSLSHFTWYQSEIEFGGEKIWAPVVAGRVYKVRMVRGGYITSEGVYVTDASLSSSIRLYYFDDWSEGDVRTGASQPLISGTGTYTWIRHPGDYIGASDDYFIMINGSDRNGFDYFKFWAETGIPSQYLEKGPGALVSSFIVNNVVYECANYGIETGGSDAVYNNTVVDATTYGIYNTENDSVINCIVQNSGTQDFLTSDGTSYCVSSDSSAGTSNNNIIDTLIFWDDRSYNYRPNISDSKIRGNGKDLIGDTLYPFNIDARTETRGRLWDRGALEFKPFNKVCYAVGFFSDDVSTKDDSGLGYEITNDLKGSTITFTLPQNDSRFGIGNMVTAISGDINTNGCFLYEKIDEYNYYVTNKTGGSVPSEVGYVSEITRPFKTLQNALESSDDIFSSSYLDSYDLVSKKVNVKIACYNDTIDYTDTDTDYGIFLDGIETDPDYFLKIFAPDNIETEVNTTQRHNGVIDTGYKLYVDDSIYGINAYSVDYIEIEGLEIKVYDTADAEPFFGMGIELDNCENYFIYGNIIYECRGNGIDVNVKDGSTDFPIYKDVIANNLIYDCVLDGIFCGDNTEVTNSNLYIYNNTIVNCQRGIYFKKPNSSTSSTCSCIGNIVQDSILQDYVEDNIQISNKFSIYNSISSDSSINYIEGRHNIINKYIEFSSRTEKNFNLNDDDLSARDTSQDLNNDDYFPFSEDIVRNERDENLWDIGAFEFNEVVGSEDLYFSPMTMRYVYANASNVTPEIILYLREDEWTDVDPDHQFQSISELNTFLLDKAYVYDYYNITIHVQAEKSFGTNSFSLRTRGLTRDVTIKTDPRELTMFPATIVYPDGSPLIDDNSYQGNLTFENLKIYSDDAATQSNLIDDTATAPLITFINCIVQVNEDSIVGNNSCIIRSFNSTLIYRNNNDSSSLYLNKGSVGGHIIANSCILSFYDSDDLTFTTTNTTSDDEVNNVLGYNYGSENFSFGNTPSKIFDSISDSDPLFKRFDLTQQDFTISDIMADNFDPQICSPLIDAGNNSYVTNEFLDINIIYDIIGNSRIYDYGIVDIGPREVEMLNLFFTSEDIIKILQDKLKFDCERKFYTSTYDDITYKDLYSKFVDEEDEAIEFIRESKVIIRIKPDYSEYKLYTDKIDEFIHEFEAYYDNSSRSIVVSKNEKYLGSMLNRIFQDGNYIFHFDERLNSLKVYINDTYEKGLSGNKNAVKSVKFGGAGVFSG